MTVCQDGRVNASCHPAIKVDVFFFHTNGTHVVQKKHLIKNLLTQRIYVHAVFQYFKERWSAFQ